MPNCNFLTYISMNTSCIILLLLSTLVLIVAVWYMSQHGRLEHYAVSPNKPNKPDSHDPYKLMSYVRATRVVPMKK